MGIATAALVIGAAGSVYAANQQRQGTQAAIDAANASANAFKSIPVPSIADQSIILQTPSLMGKYTPEQQQAMQMNVSAMQNVKADQGTVDAQNASLSGLGQIAKGGYSDSDKATASEIQKQVSSDAQARQNSILNSMAQRGVLGSGEELAARLQGNQQAVNQMSSAGDNLTSQAQARALQALGQQGQLGSSMNAQQFGQRSAIAQAQDNINQFNMQNRQNVANTNVSANNNAQAYNLQQKQGIENQRAANANTQQLHNTGLYQTQFGNEITKAGGTAGVNATNQAAQNQANQINAGTNNAMIGGIATLAGAAMSDKNQKTDIKDFNSDDFLNDLKPHTYDYKDKQYGEGKQAGVMAQDLEKNELGKKLVTDTPSGKIVDYSKAGPVTMASLVDLHNRIKELEKNKKA